MGIAVTCPGCQAHLNVRDDMAGTKGKCPKCGATLRIPASSAAAAAPLATNGPAHRLNSDVPAAAGGTAIPAPSQPTEASPSRSATLPPAPSAVQQAVEAAFHGQVPPQPVSANYRSRVFAAACGMLLLAFLYGCLVVAALVAVGWLAVAGFTSPAAAGSATGIALYLTALALGLFGALLLLKTVVAPAAQSSLGSVPLHASDEPLLHDFVRRIACEVGARAPDRIEVNCDVCLEARPPQGWRTPLGRRLRLTIGLPLVAGLTLPQLGGAIAGQLALFTRGSGKRRAYIIRILSEWFQRIATENDAWDLALLRAAGRLGAAGNWLLLPWRAGNWLVRCVPWLFMLTAHGLAGGLLRQMESTADRYQTELVGSDAFESTCHRRILLQYALRGIQSDIAMFHVAGSLPDNLPRFVTATVAQQPAEVQQTVLELIDRYETGPLDPRCTDRERIATARAQRARGVLHSDLPATALFADFEQTARSATLAYYVSRFGARFRSSAVRPVEELIDCAMQQEQASEARKRFFLGAFGLLRPLRLPAPTIEPPSSLQLVQAQLRHQRGQMQALAAAYTAEYSLYAEADRLMVDASRAVALFKAGLTPRSELFSTPFVSINQAREVRSSSSSTLESLAAKMESFEWSAGQRLHAALTLLHAPHHAGVREGVHLRAGECECLLLVVSSLGGHLADVYRLRTDHARLTAMVEHGRGNSPPREFMAELQRRTGRVYRELQALHSMLGHLDYPFPEEGRMSVARHVLPTLPAANSLQGVIESTQGFLDNLISLYGRCIDRLCALAEAAEAAIEKESTPAATK